MKTHYDALQLREIFHLEFLRWFGKKTKADQYVLKGGANLRFFFNSIRYSEDIDLDVRDIAKEVLADRVMQILGSPSFHEALRTYGIRGVVPPDLARAKQTETTQRFKVHLLTVAGEDLFSKVEFSRRGFRGETAVQAVHDQVMRSYAASPLLVPHYVLYAAIEQKIEALCTRTIIQARDVFDLYTLSPHYRRSEAGVLPVEGARLDKARDNVFEIDFAQFRDTVVAYLSHEDRAVYDNEAAWDEIRMRVSDFIGELERVHGA
jgi:hypothetical protein